ncbi:sensor domain-containing protein [Ferirhizobium litorale]|uniref:Diguanylate cyclase n=1 Tax=Ferirhizobium litorale TaxID=2927786 RepID=A0AAE3U0L6_9HYPH|nr:diguanylate cyclase [Fererhizobium litorale]MDI7921491.1 diguanylate cyclase [Fererhizobium litorale]
MNDGGTRLRMPEEPGEPLSERARRLLAVAEAFATANVLAIGDAGVALPFVDILDALPDFIYVKDRQGRFVYANEATANAHGFQRAAEMLGLTDFELYPMARAMEFHAAEQQLMAADETLTVVAEQLAAADGRLLWRHTTKAPLKNAGREVIGLVGLARDVTDRAREHLLLQGQARLLEMIARSEPLPGILDALVRLVEAELDGISCSILLLDHDDRRLRTGAAPSLPAAYSQLIDGISIGPGVGSCGTAAWRGEPVVVSDIMSDPLWADYRGLAAEYGLRSCWSTPIMTAGRHVLGTFALYSGEARSPGKRETDLVAMATHLAGIAVERQRTEERIRFMAHHDPLTGLPNRSFFEERLADALDGARAGDCPLSLAFIDVDNFKVVNDTLGHRAGDTLLKELAARMDASLRAGDIAARLGGDEFAVVFAHRSGDDREVDARLGNLHAAMSEPVWIGGEMIAASCSMGVAVFPVNGDTPEQLLSTADAAMYRAKQSGRNNVQRV